MGRCRLLGSGATQSGPTNWRTKAGPSTPTSKKLYRDSSRVNGARALTVSLCRVGAGPKLSISPLHSYPVNERNGDVTPTILLKTLPTLRLALTCLSCPACHTATP